MKQGWEIKKLDEVCEVEYGTRVVNKRDGGTVYPVYGGGGATFFMDTFNRENCFIVSRFAMSQQCTRFVEGKFFLNDSGLSVKPRNHKDILQDFLNLQMLFLNDHIYSLARGTAQKNLDVPAFRNIEISYPKSLTEQQHIVEILDDAFAAIAKAKANAEQNLKNTKELFESYLQGMFKNNGDGWEIKKLGEVCEVITKGTTPTSLGFKFTDEGVNFIKVESLTESGQIIPNKVAYISEECHKYLKRSQLKENDILFSIAGALGRIGIVKKEIIPANTNQALAIVRLAKNSGISVSFLAMYFTSNVITEEIEKLKGGAAQQNLSLGQLNNLSIPFPTLPQHQQDIVQKLDALSIETKKLEAIYNQKINDLEELKKSVLQKAFSGELKTEKELV